MAEGAGLWFTKRLVVARAARAYYGIDSMRVYNPDDPEHVARRANVVGSLCLLIVSGYAKPTVHFIDRSFALTVVSVWITRGLSL